MQRPEPLDGDTSVFAGQESQTPLTHQHTHGFNAKPMKPPTAPESTPPFRSADRSRKTPTQSRTATPDDGVVAAPRLGVATTNPFSCELLVAGTGVRANVRVAR